MTASNVRLQRAYDEPGPEDGHRVLVDRVWPRGRTKEHLRLDAWERDLGPSTRLRQWFGHDPERWQEFQARYHQELAQPDQARTLDELAAAARLGPSPSSMALAIASTTRPRSSPRRSSAGLHRRRRRA